MDRYSDGTPIEDLREDMAAFFGEEFHEEKENKPPTAMSTNNFAVPHPRHYHEGGIVDSAPIFMADKPQWRKRQKITERYEAVNRAYQQARAEQCRTFSGLTRIAPGLLKPDKKRLVSRLRTSKDVLIPVPVTILGIYPESSSRRVGAAKVQTAEYQMLEIGDVEDVPFGLKTGYVLRFTSADGKVWFRMGWKRSDEERLYVRRTNGNGSDHKVTSK